MKIFNLSILLYKKYKWRTNKMGKIPALLVSLFYFNNVDGIEIPTCQKKKIYPVDSLDKMIKFYPHSPYYIHSLYIKKEAFFKL